MAHVGPLVPVVPEKPANVSIKEGTELCQAFSKLLLTVHDVDEQDSDLPQLCSEYVKEIYKYLHTLEVRQSLPFSDLKWILLSSGSKVTCTKANAAVIKMR